MSSLSAIPSSKTSSLPPTPRSALHYNHRLHIEAVSSYLVQPRKEASYIIAGSTADESRSYPGPRHSLDDTSQFPADTFGLARRSTSGLGPAKIDVAFRPSCRQGARLISLADKQVETLELGDGTPPLCELALWRSFSPSTQATNVSILSLFSSQLSSTNPSKLCKPCLHSC
jgi:hypothetical protein